MVGPSTKFGPHYFLHSTLLAALNLDLLSVYINLLFLLAALSLDLLSVCFHLPYLLAKLNLDILSICLPLLFSSSWLD